MGIGTATVTVTTRNKNDDTLYTDSIEITVLEAAGEFKAFLNLDQGGTSYYDFWIHGNDYDLRHMLVDKSMISVYSLRSGVTMTVTTMPSMIREPSSGSMKTTSRLTRQ